MGQIMTIEIGDKVFHRKTSEVIYEIVGVGRMQVFNHWFECVIYKNSFGETFVRERDDFMEKFIKKYV